MSGSRLSLDTLANIASRFDLGALQPRLEVCRHLAVDQAPLDVAVLGQFKAGKSSLLNTLAGFDLLPTGVTPVTAIITRLTFGERVSAWVSHLDGTGRGVSATDIADYVAEARNPNNCKQVAAVDLACPSLKDMAGLRLVDTPGLGSLFEHNSRLAREWLPNVGIALVVMSADRALGEEDRRLLAELHEHAPRVAVILTKIDLLCEQEQEEIRRFVSGSLADTMGGEIPIFLFSTRQRTDQWLMTLRDQLLLPLCRDLNAQREDVLQHKLRSLVRTCTEYLQIARQASTQAEADRRRLQMAVMDESTSEAVIRDELLITSKSLCARNYETIRQRLEKHQDELRSLMITDLKTSMEQWKGHLGHQSRQFEAWMKQYFTEKLHSVSNTESSTFLDLIKEAETRFTRILDAFRDRLARHVSAATGVTLTKVAWQFDIRQPRQPDIEVSSAFAIHVDSLWFLFPMAVFGGLFHRRLLSRVPWEVEKNLSRLTTQWSDQINAAVAEMQKQAVGWVQKELETIQHLLTHTPNETSAVDEALANLGDLESQLGHTPGTQAPSPTPC